MSLFWSSNKVIFVKKAIETKIEKYDIAICGAGPAGSTTALALENSGLKVVLIDKSSFPRDKICGDAVGAYVKKVLHTINPKYSEALVQFSEKEVINSIRIVAPNTKYIDINYKADGFTATRVDFDNFLFQLASKLDNVTVKTNTIVKDIKDIDNKILIDTHEGLQIEVKLVIGCDGAQSIVNKKLTDTKIDLEHYAGAVRAYFRNVKKLSKFHFRIAF